MLFKTHNKVTSCAETSSTNKTDWMISDFYNEIKNPHQLSASKSLTSKFGLTRFKIDLDKTSLNLESKPTMYETINRQSSIDKLNNLFKKEEHSIKKIKSTVKLNREVISGYNWKIGPQRWKTPKSFFKSKRNKSNSKQSKIKGFRFEDMDQKFDLASQVTSSNQSNFDKGFCSTMVFKENKNEWINILLGIILWLGMNIPSA